jgi:hypothetical protein
MVPSVTKEFSGIRATILGDLGGVHMTYSDGTRDFFESTDVALAEFAQPHSCPSRAALAWARGVLGVPAFALPTAEGVA